MIATKHTPNETYVDWIGVSTGSPDDYRAACAQNGKENPHCVSQPAANLHYRTQMLNTSMMSKACCKNPKNLFCFVCGLYILSHHKRSIMTRPLLEAYESYFKVRTTKENYLQGPPSVCNVCNNAMLRWKNGMCPKPELPFAIPMLWSQPADHETDCYFCLTRTAPMAGKRRTHLSHAAGPIEYPILRSAIRPKLFATRPSFASQSLAPVRRQISVPDRLINEQAEGVSSVSIRTYPRQSLKPKESPVVNGVMPVVRRSLPAQKIVSGIVATHPSTAAGTLKRKLEPDVVGTDMTYGMTKVRLRNSEPTIVLEKCKKLLPSNSAAIIRRPMTPNSVNAPRILNVFSLNKDAVNCETEPTIPSPETSPLPPQAIVKIEIEDDDEDDVADYNVAAVEDTHDESTMELDPTTGELRKIEDAVVTATEEKEPTNTVPKQTVAKLEPPTPPPPPSSSAQEQKVQLVGRGKLGFINVKDLATTTTAGGNNAIKIKLSPLDEASTVPPAVKEEAVATEKKIPQITNPSRYCFINMKDMPSVSANNVERLVKITSPIVTGHQQLQQSADNAAVASATAKSTVVPAASTAQGSTKPQQAAPDQDDGPHRITQSELILLLRELELPKQKSAILIDRLKRWNLLAIEMVGTNRNRSMEPPQQQTPTTTAPSSSLSSSSSALAAASSTSSSSSSSPSPSSTSSPAAPTSSEKVLSSITSMKDIQIRNTRSVNRQSTGPPIITSSTSVRTNTTTAVNSKPPSTVVSANQNGGPTAAKPIPPTSVKVVPAVVKSERFVPPRRHQSAVTATAAGQGSEEKPAPRGTITTRSATSAIVKQNTTSPRVK